MRRCKKKMVFTLIEIVIVLVIIAILATLMIPAYFNLIEKSKNTACETNERVLLGALEMYGAENPVLPASLSELREKDIQRAWVKIFSEQGSWKIRLAYAVANFDSRQLAYATTGWLQEYLGLVKGPACPNDLTPPPLDFSYGINEELVSRPSSELINADMDLVVIADSEAGNFTYPAARHTRHSLSGASKFAIGIARDKEIVYFPQEPSAGGFNGPPSSGIVPNATGDSRKQCRNKCRVEWQKCKNQISGSDHDAREECREKKKECMEACPER